MKKTILSTLLLSSISLTTQVSADGARCQFDAESGSSRCDYQFKRHGSYGTQDLNINNDQLGVAGSSATDLYASQYYKKSKEATGYSSDPFDYKLEGTDLYAVLLALLEDEQYQIKGIYNDQKALSEIAKYKIYNNINYVDMLPKDALINHITSNTKEKDFPMYYKTPVINFKTKSNWVLLNADAHKNDPDHVKINQVIEGIDKQHFKFKARKQNAFYLKDFSNHYQSEIYVSEYPCKINGECVNKFAANLRYCTSHEFVKNCYFSGTEYKDMLIVYDIGGFEVERFLRHTQKGTIVEFKAYKNQEDYLILDKNISLLSPAEEIKVDKSKEIVE